MLCQIFTQHAAWGKQLMHRWVCRIVEWTKGILSISNQGKHIQLYGRRVMPFYLLCLVHAAVPTEGCRRRLHQS